jgi:hypothetical protein
MNMERNLSREHKVELRMDREAEPGWIVYLGSCCSSVGHMPPPATLSAANTMSLNFSLTSATYSAVGLSHLLKSQSPGWEH